MLKLHRSPHGQVIRTHPPLSCAYVRSIIRKSNLAFSPTGSLYSSKACPCVLTRVFDDDYHTGHSDWMENNESEARWAWEHLMEHPEEYWDNRVGKLNPKSPDFKHKANGQALWLNDVPDCIADDVEAFEEELPLPRTKEEAWLAVIQSPEQYWDNRVNKLNPKSPDFKHKSTGKALWLTDASDWVVEQLQSLPAPTAVARQKPAGRDALWEAVLSDPGQFYDNRLSKTNPKAPDFKHKSSGEALWLNSAPKSILERLT